MTRPDLHLASSRVITDEEWVVLQRIPEQDLVELAIDFDILVPREIDARGLLNECLHRALERAGEEGLPFSKYDREDLVALPAPHLAAIARLQGLTSEADVDQVLKVGRKVYRTYQAQRPGNAFALLLPSLLPALARIAATVQER